MKKILLSLAIIGLVGGIVGGLTWAEFTTEFEMTGNTISTGDTVGLQVRGVHQPTNSWTTWRNSQLKFNDLGDWENPWPGWEKEFEVQLQNISDSEAGLNIVPQVARVSGTDSSLFEVITMQFENSEGEKTEALTLEEWGGNHKPVEYIPYNQSGERWIVRFAFPPKGENQDSLKGREVGFNLTFEGVTRPEAPVTRVTNLDTGDDRSTDIQDVIDKAEPGNTILVPANHSYSVNLDIDVRDLTLRAEEPYLQDPATLTQKNHWEPTVEINAHGVTVEGFSFRDFHTNSAIVTYGRYTTLTNLDILKENTGDYAIEIRDENSASVRHSTFRASEDAGKIILLRNVDDVEIYSNHFEPTGLKLQIGALWLSGTVGDLEIRENAVLNDEVPDLTLNLRPDSVNGHNLRDDIRNTIIYHNPGIDTVEFNW